MVLGGRPVANARVRLLDGTDGRLLEEVASDEAGAARLATGRRKGAVFEVRAAGARVFREESDHALEGSSEAFAVTLEEGVSFVGRVVDAESGEPVAGASVLVLDRWFAANTGKWHSWHADPTDAEGRFLVPGLRAGETDLEVRAPGHQRAALTVRVADGKVAPEVVVARLLRGARVRGVVVSALGRPVAGAEVVAGADWDDASEAEFRVKGARYTSDGRPTLDSIDRFQASELDLGWKRDETLGAVAGLDGTFVIEGAQPKQAYALRASARGHAPSAWVHGAGGDPEAAPVVVTLRRPATVLVRVVLGEAGEPSEETRVRVFGPWERVHPSGRDPSGAFRFEDVEPGPTAVFAENPGFLPAVERVAIVEGATLEVRLVLGTGAAASGVVVDAEGNLLPRAEVMVASAKPNADWTREMPLHLKQHRRAETDARGRFTLRGLELGESMLVAEWAGRGGVRLRTEEPLRFRAPTDDLRVVLGSRGRVRVRLVATDRTPIEGEARFEAQRDGIAHGGRSELRDGRLESPPLEDGEYEVLVVPPRHAWFTRKAAVRAGVSVDLGDVVVDPGASVRGRVADPQGRPISGAAVRCLQLESDERATFTDAEGRFEVPHCPREPIHLSFSAQGCGDFSQRVEPGRTGPLEVVLSAPTDLRLRVRRPEGAAPAPTRVVLCRPDALRVPIFHEVNGQRHEATNCLDAKIFTVDASGEARVEVPAGRWVVRCKWPPEGKERIVAEWDLVGGTTQEVELVLPALVSDGR